MYTCKKQKMIENIKIKIYKMEFPKKYFRARSEMNRLDKIATKERYLTNKWIIGQEKNPYDIQERPGNKITRMDTEYFALVDWTLPKTKYAYKEVSMAQMCEPDEYKLVRSSIIPLVDVRGEKNWLLGSFHDYEKTGNPILTDFAGTCENIDRNKGCPATACAIRELSEESKGLLLQPILKSMNDKNKVAIFEGRNGVYKEKVYFIFVSVEYEEVWNIPEYFARTNRLDGKEKLGPIHFYPQSEIKKFTFRTAKNITDFLMYLNE